MRRSGARSLITMQVNIWHGGGSSDELQIAAASMFQGRSSSHQA
jgi:hypothetical protein